MAKTKSSKTDFLYEQVLNRVLNGDYVPNTKIPPESEIAREFEISRPVVRNALARLKREGVLVSRRGSGTVVREAQATRRPSFGPVESVEDMWYCFEFRLHFETSVADIAARNRNPDDLARIDAALDQLRALKSLDMLETVDLDMAFHQTVVAATHNRYLIGTFDTWLPQVRFTCSLSANLTQSRAALRQKQILQAHGKIAQTIHAQDRKGAVQAMTEHIKSARRTVFHGRLLFGEDDDE